MTPEITRRRALTGLGTVSLGALLAACGGGDSKDGDAATTGADVPTTGGGTSTVQPQSSTRAATADLFESAPSCTLTPELTEGPYYFDVDSIRTDIREDREGARLRLAIRARDAASCEPIPDAVVDIWHCDAIGSYSGFEAASAGSSGGPPGVGGGPTDDETYLRGAQVTNADGIVELVTIYPGWYRGRTIHIHAKVHLDGSTALTTQLFFDESVSEQVLAQEPYASDAGRDTFNDGDSIFEESLLLGLSEDGDGYLGVINLDVAAG